MTIKALVEKLTVDILSDASTTNRNGANKDTKSNRVSYGYMMKSANILTFLGQEVDVACWEENGQLRVECITINGKKINLHPEYVFGK